MFRQAPQAVHGEARPSDAARFHHPQTQALGTDHFSRHVIKAVAPANGYANRLMRAAPRGGACVLMNTQCRSSTLQAVAVINSASGNTIGYVPEHPFVMFTGSMVSFENSFIGETHHWAIHKVLGRSNRPSDRTYQHASLALRCNVVTVSDQPPLILFDCLFGPLG